MVDDQNSIEHRRQEWIDAVNSREVDQYVDLLTDDVVWFPPGQPAFQGRVAFESWLRPFFDRYSYEFSITNTVLKLSGRWAVERGVFHSVMSSSSDQTMMQHEGKYLIIWRKDEDDIWRIERYIDETDSE